MFGNLAFLGQLISNQFISWCNIQLTHGFDTQNNLKMTTVFSTFLCLWREWTSCWQELLTGQLHQLLSWLLRWSKSLTTGSGLDSFLHSLSQPSGTHLSVRYRECWNAIKRQYSQCTISRCQSSIVILVAQSKSTTIITRSMLTISLVVFTDKF